MQKSFIPTQKINELLEQSKQPSKQQVEEILAKSKSKQRLEMAETAALLNLQDPELLQKIFTTAHELKEEMYGNRIVMFAPLYVGNECVNDCVYCGFRISNKNCFRKTLSKEELINETQALEKRGHKRLIMVYGEHPMYSPEYIADTVHTVYNTKIGNGEIRRVNINAAPMDVEGYKVVKDIGIGTYQIFQETYHEPTYKKIHPSGPKSDFLWRLYGLDRAMQAGIDDLGIGALLGLHDWRFEVMGLLAHTIHLEERFGVGPHTISFPRIEPANGTDWADNPPAPISDEDFMKLVAIIRLSVPYTGMILTAREPAEIRNKIIPLGCSQIDAGSSIGIGEYSQNDKESFKKSQFILGDQRSLDQVVRELCQAGFLPSWCTACYRLGRTGENFMKYSKPGDIKSFCHPNAILTFSEYLIDYATPETKKVGLAMVEREIAKIPASFRGEVEKNVEKLKNGERDLYF
ncbi:MAG: 2-iminoacetate synthase [Candidatus Cloacimonadota bacterium]|jgi:2-iminoacetate synthase|nr:2-iminoacetate synthase [Candidatus Cloacimonadota bacterium]